METAKVYFYIYTTHLELINLSKNELSNWIVICLSSSSSSWTTLRTKHKKRDYSRGKYTCIFPFRLDWWYNYKGEPGNTFAKLYYRNHFFAFLRLLCGSNQFKFIEFTFVMMKILKGYMGHGRWHIIPNRSRGLSTIWWCIMIPKSGERKGRIGQ